MRIKIACSTITTLVLGTDLVKAGSDSHDAIRRHADLAKKQDTTQGHMSVGYYVSPSTAATLHTKWSGFIAMWHDTDLI